MSHVLEIQAGGMNLEMSLRNVDRMQLDIFNKLDVTIWRLRVRHLAAGPKRNLRKAARRSFPKVYLAREKPRTKATTT